MQQLTKAEFLAQFDESVHEAIISNARRLHASAVVMFENQMMDSRQFGQRTALCVGLTCTYQTVEECEGKWLNDLPSQRQYPQTYVLGLDLCEIKETKMSKTLVKAAHPGGPFKNGVDGCHTRWATGFCSGIRTADWLNGLGEDDAPYFRSGRRPEITNLIVRMNWLRGDNHIVPINEIEWEQCTQCHGMGKVIKEAA